MGRRGDEELPPVEVLGAAPQISSVQQVSTRRPRGPLGRRGVGLILGTVVVGLLVAGAMLGDGDGAPPASEREEEPPATRSPPTTTRPRPTTTTLAEPLFAGHDVRGWLLSGGQNWTLVDLESGALLEPGLPFDNPFSVRPVPGGVVLIVGEEAMYYDLRVPAEVREPVNLGPAMQVFHTPVRERVWLVEAPSEASPDGGRARLVDLDGREHRSFQVPLEPFRTPQMGFLAAPTEGVPFGRGGEIYLANEAGVESVAIGDLIGVVGSSFLVFTCDEDAASCGVDLRAFSGGVIRRLDVEKPSSDFGLAVSSAADGRFALVTHNAPNGNTSEITLHRPDGATIATVEVPGFMEYAPGWLSNDAGLVGAFDGRIVWIHPTSNDWVVDPVPALQAVLSVGVLLIPDL